MKIQLDVKALRDLIELQGEEFELELKKAVIAAYASGNKILLSTEVQSYVDKEIRKMYETEVKNRIGEITHTYRGISLTLNKDFENEISLWISKNIKDKIAESLNVKNFMETAEQKINERLEYLAGLVEKKVESYMTTTLENKIQEEVDRRINEAFAIIKGK